MLSKYFKFHYLTIAAYSTSTWKRTEAAVANLEKFKIETKIKVEWPLNEHTIIEFCKWAGVKNYFSPSTTKAYIASFKFLLKLGNWKTDCCENFLAKSMIRGAENIKCPSENTKHRLAMNLPLLKLLGHQIKIQNWSNRNKQTYWTACCLAFFGSLRMGEILAPVHNNFDPISTLTWGDIKLFKDCWIVHIKSPKSRKPGGEFVNIFKFQGHNCCPYNAISTLHQMSTKTNMNAMPVFTFDNGRHLTKQNFNATLTDLLKNIPGLEKGIISGHSFRAGIPSMLNKNPECNSNISKEWGRWKSQASDLYARIHYEARRSCFEKICNSLNSSKI